MKVITLTLNPAFDVHCKTKNFRLGHESFFEILSQEAGGKGINISRALLSAKTDNTAIAVVGKDNGKLFLNKLQKDGVRVSPVFVDGRIRENYILHDESEIETRVSFNGFKVDKSLFAQVINAIGDIDGNTVLTLTGSNPDGLNIKEIKDFVLTLKKSGVKVIIDSRSFTLKDLIEVKPFLIKPNKDEIATYLNREITSCSDALNVAKSIRERGVENVIISLGEEGAVLSSCNGEFYCKPQKINAVSTIGAGDSTVAGFIYAYILGVSGKDALKYAVSFGTAACLKAGTLPPDFNDIKEIFSKIE